MKTLTDVIKTISAQFKTRAVPGIKKILMIFGLLCIIGGFLLFILLVINSYNEYKGGLSYPDIIATRELLHEATQYANIYAQKVTAIDEVIGNNPIRSEKGLETIHLNQDNQDTTLKKSIELTQQAQERNPHSWDKLTELISKRLDERQQEYSINKETFDNMQRVYDNKMTDEEWVNYTDNQSKKIDAWNKLREENTNFNIDNEIEKNPNYESLDISVVQKKYKPNIKDFIRGLLNWTTLEITEKYDYKDEFPIISAVYDDLGNTVKTSEFNKYVGLDKYKNNTSLKSLQVSSYIAICVDAADYILDGEAYLTKKTKYLFTSNSPDFNSSYEQLRGKETYTETPCFLYKVTPNDIKNTNGSLKIEVKIEVEGNTHRVQDKNYDDSAYIEYPLVQ